MQTFLPINTVDYSEVAKVLDNKRLNKQASEAWQILMVLTKLDPQGNHREPKGWVNHPAVKMWRGHEYNLGAYALAMVEEWKERNFSSTIDEKVKATLKAALSKQVVTSLSVNYPSWMSLDGDRVASTHRKALLVKDYDWYSQFGWEEDPGYKPIEYEYYWPVD